ncbi:protein CHROMATIN REMODELING 24 isoform X2 [Lathyrus oleraceus]|uniref:protein CHROMATIN REMODELING 24 isoform X2 n=1 Tax=Pisum sativum TaxID=3888 RepID=UPI0021D3225C|nr:protein CHROMATIN REMODELING 24 isoform X2 [Pisum sativum]
MANKSVKKPQSLNDSHYRFLQDFSAPPKPSSHPLNNDQYDTPIQPRSLMYHDDDTIPQFSAITDFDSPIEEAHLPNQVPQFFDDRSLSQNYSENRQQAEVEEAPIPNKVPQFLDSFSLGQHYAEKHQPVNVEEALFPKEVPQGLNNYSLSQNHPEKHQAVNAEETTLRPKEVLQGLDGYTPSQNHPEKRQPVSAEETTLPKEFPQGLDGYTPSQNHPEKRQPVNAEETLLPKEVPQGLEGYTPSQNHSEKRQPVNAEETLLPKEFPLGLYGYTPRQNYLENRQPVKVEKALLPKKVPQDLDDYSLSQNSLENGQPVNVEKALLPNKVPHSFISSSLKEEKKAMVKVQGRRRLCKVADTDASKNVAVDDSKFDDLVDFDSPIPVRKNVIEIDKSRGKSDIRDILHELSSKFDALSVEKKPKPAERFVGRKEILEDEGFEFGSAGSSFSPKQEPHDFSSKHTKNDTNGVGYESDDSVQVLDHLEPENDGSITLNDPRSTYKLQPKIAKMLYPHQREGLKWLWSLHVRGKGGILGDDMGLGKTMQICGFIAGLFHSRLIRRVLVVAPKTLLPHWIKELSVVGLSEKTKEYFGTCAKAREYELQYILQNRGVLLTTYDIVRNNTKSLQGHRYLNNEDNEDDPTWDYMILDEGHLIKNPNTQRAKSLLEIPSAHRIIISGTPLQNNLKELWALFSFCCPELLGDKKWFKDKYETPILRGNDKNASDREKRTGSSIAKELRDHIQPYFLRRLKSEVFNQDTEKTTAKLSQKQEIIVWLRLSNIQRHLYEAFLKSEIVLSAFDGSPLAALTILKKICDHPLLLTKRAAEDVLEGLDSMLKPEEVSVAEKLAMHIADVAETDKFKDEHDVSCKISFIMSLLDNLIPEGHRVLIFSQTRKMLNLIQDCISSKGYDFLRIDGTTKSSDRIKVVDDFQDGVGAPIFLLTSQVGGLGLTLTRADRVIVVDPAWNPSTDNQSVDRAYRIGQKKDVIVYRLMTCGTVEEKIYRKQVYKGGLFKTVSEQKEQTRYFSQQDLRELFSLPKEGFDVSVTQRQLDEKHDCRHIVDASFHAHIEFLKRQGIAGISHHSLLFSKSEPVQDAPENEVTRINNTKYFGTSSSSSREQTVDGAEFAFNPKDVNLHKKDSSPSSVGKLTELEIKDRIVRLSQMLSNTVMISKLPDKGEKLRKRITELNRALTKLKMEQTNVVDLDDITDEFERVVNV